MYQKMPKSNRCSMQYVSLTDERQSALKFSNIRQVPNRVKLMVTIELDTRLHTLSSVVSPALLR